MSGFLSDPELGLTLIGHELNFQYRQAFQKQEWDGVPWKERSCPNVIGALADLIDGREEPKPHRLKKGPALIDTSNLMNNAAFNRVGRYSIAHGSNLPYARPQTKGEPSSVGPITKDVQIRLWNWMRKIGTKTSVCGKTIRQAFGWLLNKNKTGEMLEFDLPERQFIGLTDDTRVRINVGLQRLIAGL